MGEYEDRYPEAYGQSEENEAAIAKQRLGGIGLPRQVRDTAPVAGTPRPAEPRMRELVPRVIVPRTPTEICDDVYERLNANPTIDTSGIVISVSGSEVTLDGTINSLIAVSMAQSIVSNTPGVSRALVQLRVVPSPETAAG